MKSYGKIFRLVFMLAALSSAHGQSARERQTASPLSDEVLVVPAPDLSARQITAQSFPILPSSQSPQAFPPVQYKTSGKEFYFVFLSSVSSDGSGTLPLRRIFISSRAHVRVRISHVGGSWSQSFEALPRSLTPITLPTWASLDRVETEAAYKRVFKVEAEDNVAVYALSPNYLSSDGFLVLPKESLGREYVVASVRNALWYGSGTIGPIGGNPNPRSEFGVAAIEDGTEVTVKLTADSYTGRFLKGNYYTFTLRRGEVMQFMARDTGRKALVNYWDNLTQSFIPKNSWVGKEPDGTDCDFTGSQVLSNKPVAVFSGHERAAIPDQLEFAYEDHPSVSRDHLIEQMPPVEVWGKHFVVIGSLQCATGTRPAGSDLVRVIARYNGTVLFINGIYRDTLNEGEYSQFLSNDFSAIETTQPALVVKYLLSANPETSPGVGDPDMTVVPPLENMSTFYTLPSIHMGSFFNEHFINLIIDSAALGTTLLNGLPPDNTQFRALPNLPYMYARFRTEFEGEQRVESSLPCYAETYGYGDVDSYSFAGGGDFNYIRALAAENLNFGFVKLGDSRDSVTTILSTLAPSPLADTVTVFGYSWESGDTTVFSILDTVRAPIKLAPGQTVPVSFSFKPVTKGAFRAKLKVWSNNFTPVYITVLGSSGTNHLQVDYNTIDFGRVRVKDAKPDSFLFYVISDDGAGSIKIYDRELDKQVAPYFITTALEKDRYASNEGSVTRFVTFIPDSVGYFRDTIDLSNDGTKIDTSFVYLYGRGVRPDVTTSGKDFGDIRYETASAWVQIPVINKGTDTSAIRSIELYDGNVTDFDIQSIPVTVLLDTVGSPLNTRTYEARFEPHYTSLNLIKNDIRSCRVLVVTIDGDSIFATLRGRAVEPWFEASPITIDFGTVKNPLLSDPGQITKRFALRNVGSMQGLLNALTIPSHAATDTPYYFSVAAKPVTPYAVDSEDSIDVTFSILNVGVFRDSVVVENDSRRQPLVYFTASVEAEYDLNDSIYLDTVTDCLPIDTIVHIVNPYRIPITITDTLFSGNPGGFTFFPKVIVTDPPITIAPGQYFDFTVRYEFPIDSVNGDQIFYLIFTKPVVLAGIKTYEEDTVKIVLTRRMQILDLVAGKLPYNPNAKDAPFRLPIHIKGKRLGKPELDNMTVGLHFSNLLVAPVGIDRTGSLTESTPTNGIPPQPQWSWDESTRTMLIPIKDAKLSTDPSNNTLLFTLIGTTYLTTDTLVEITPEIEYTAKPCAYRISRDSTTVIYANECGDRTIRNLLLRDPAFSIGSPYPDPSSASDASGVKIPYIAMHDYTVQWKLYDELGTVCFTSASQHIPKGTGSLTIDKKTLKRSGLYLFEVTVSDETSVLGTHSTRFVVTE